MCWVKSFYFSFLVDWEHVTTPRAFTQTHKWMAVRLKAMLFLFLKSWHFGDTCKVFTPDPGTTRKKNELNVTLSKNLPDHDSHCSSVLYSIAHLAGWGVGGLPLLFSHSNTSPLWPYTGVIEGQIQLMRRYAWVLCNWNVQHPKKHTFIAAICSEPSDRRPGCLSGVQHLM